jgi:hypothetical protein
MGHALLPPTIRELQDAPHRAVLYVLAACTLSAESALVQNHPDVYYPDHVSGRQAPSLPPALRTAAHLLLTRIAHLQQALALYEGALVAAVHDDTGDDLPF